MIEYEKPEPTGMISLDYDFTNKEMNYNPKPRAKIRLETKEEVRKCGEGLKQKTRESLKNLEEAKRASLESASTIILD